jgi:AraC-like DNA-binding protein/mannose-6-phosphate isomerase-like protein (cupin superfamily)
MARKSTSIPVYTLTEEYDATGIVILHGTSGNPALLNDVDHSHRHNFHFFLLLLKGNIHIETDFEQQEITTPAILYVHPGQVHRIVEADNVDGYFLGMKNEHLNPAYLTLLEQVLPVKPLSLTAGISAIIRRTMALCAAIAERKTEKLYFPVLRDYCNAFVGFIVSQYLEQTLPAGASSRFDIVTKKFKLLLEYNFTVMKRPSDYASRLNISMPYLNECIRNTTGIPVSRYIRQRIILEAKRMLYHSDKSIKEIACELGYDDCAYFSRLFTKVAGMTALAFRNKNFG